MCVDGVKHPSVCHLSEMVDDMNIYLCMYMYVYIYIDGQIDRCILCMNLYEYT